MKQSKFYMQQALEQAALALGFTRPNPVVGCVVVKDGNIIAKGFHAKAGQPHAEVNALIQAGAAAGGADLYVTLEPCAHFGRTPPCVQAIIKAGIKRVFVAMLDPNPLVAGKGVEQLKQANIEVNVGILTQQAAQLNEVFIKWVLTKRPFIVSKLATSLDGKVATANLKSKWLTNTVARQMGHLLRSRYDAILVGAKTVALDNPHLSCRLDGREGKQPIKIVVTSDGQIPLDANLWAATAPVIIVTTPHCRTEQQRQLEQRGAKVIVCRRLNGRVDIVEAVEKLAQEGIQSILLEGGATINGAFYDCGLVDKIYCFIGDKILGGAQDLVAIAGQGVEDLTQAMSLEFAAAQIVDNNIWIEAYNRHRKGKYSEFLIS